MTKYIVKRILMIIPIALITLFFLFIMLYSLTGSQISSMPAYGDGDALDAVFDFFQAGDNIFTKYLRYCYNLFIHLELGKSADTGLSIINDLDYRIRNTLLIVAAGGSATFLVGVPLGILAAVRKNRLTDKILNVVTLFFSAIPTFSVAVVIMLVIAKYLRLLPAMTSYKSLTAFIMPTATILFGGAAAIARITRTSMLEVLEQPYITALRANGLGKRAIIYRHALKNALVPVVAALGGFIAQILCGAIVVERFFNVPGLGTYLLNTVSSRDHSGCLAGVFLLTIVLTVTNIAADIIYAFVNPQIKRRYTKTTTLRHRKEAV